MANEKNTPTTTPSNAGTPAWVNGPRMERLKKLSKQRDEALAKIRKLQGRNLALQNKAEQRKRFLAGEAILDDAAKTPETSKHLMLLLDSILKRDEDRALFELHNKPAISPSPTSQPVAPKPSAAHSSKAVFPHEQPKKPATLPPSTTQQPVLKTPDTPALQAALPPRSNNAVEPPQIAPAEIPAPNRTTAS